jgi:hypothetical protein
LRPTVTFRSRLPRAASSHSTSPFFTTSATRRFPRGPASRRSACHSTTMPCAPLTRSPRRFSTVERIRSRSAPRPQRYQKP